MAEEYLSVSPPNGKPASLHDSARGSPEPFDSFGELVKDINSVLGPCNGIDSAGIDVEELKNTMREYRSCGEEWQQYAFADHSRAYTRNLVDNCNGKSNLNKLVLVWTPGKGSPIHDHANAHCVMKILKGSLKETLYGWPCQSSDGPSDCATSPSSACPSTKHTCSFRGNLEPAALQIRRSTTYEANQVTYMSDRLGLHRIENPSDSEVAISLHLYTPPNAAKHGCHIFDASTGKKSHVSQCHFYSEFGIKK
ncbi:hypothetical protein LTR37_001693 [Vermiconidia calcicola]|uniref:Uncharacterized protein n=1 Tax=Vermiconidia calcicola TaxID=1690605 RepID=A0ACC3NUF6_9PEZI|nr:hypothetical protein LTR37_001693 [Vermiconidia calcicola]